jgi:hypothetical protein
VKDPPRIDRAFSRKTGELEENWKSPPSEDLAQKNNKTFTALEDRVVVDDGPGIEIIITIAVGLSLFIVNGVAFLKLALKKRKAQKVFRKNLEVSQVFRLFPRIFLLSLF